MARINKEEYQLLKELENRDFKWLAKDRDKTLIASQSRPSKTDEMWRDERTRLCFNYKDSQLFQFIQWEDDSPYNIQELIDEYEEYLRTPVAPKFSIDGVEHLFENESEEVEVKKDMDWLNNELEKVIKAVESDDIYFAGKDDYDEGYIDGIRDVQPIINQLEIEVPEVLSDKWIDDNSVYASSDGITEEYVHVDDLENLLVPKQELPVIPKFVAEWIEKNDVSYSSYIRYLVEAHNGDYYYINNMMVNDGDLTQEGADKLCDWAKKQKQSELLKLINGYTIEEEQKYIVSDSHGRTLLAKMTYSYKGKTLEEVQPYNELIVGFKKELTEQEIKDYDERYLAFKVPVEEME